MDGLGILREVIPERIGILQVSLRVPLLSVNEMRELGRVTNEEDGGVIEDPIPVTFLSPELDSKATGVTGSVGRTGFTTDGGETHCSSDFLADFLEEGRGGDVSEIMSDLEVTVGAGTLSMDNSLGNTLTIEVSKEIDVVEILKKEGS